MAEQRTVIYLRGTDAEELDDAEKRCGEYAARFGWQVLGTVRDRRSTIRLNDLISKVRRMQIQIILTGNFDMISSDPQIRDDLMMEVERNQCFVHPIEAQRNPKIEPA